LLRLGHEIIKRIPHVQVVSIDDGAARVSGASGDLSGLLGAVPSCFFFRSSAIGYRARGRAAGAVALFPSTGRKSNCGAAAVE
jgi:hypothetical protein